MKISFCLLASVALLLAARPAAHGQQLLYTTDFESGYTQGNDLVGQQGWVGNDEPSVAEAGSATDYHGGLNSVLATSGAAPLVGTAGAVFGEVHSGGFNVYPGAPSVYVAHPFSQTAMSTFYGFSLKTDFVITPPATTPTTSGYGFAFLNSSGANVFSAQFVKDTATPGQDVVRYQVGAAAPSAASPAISIGLNGAYTLSLSIDINPAGGAATGNIKIGGATVFSGIPLGTAANVLTVTQAGAIQFINGAATPDGLGGYRGAGDDQLTFDNFTVSVPEPSTYVMMGAGLLGLAATMKYRQRRA